MTGRPWRRILELAGPWGGEASGRVWVRIRPSSVTGRRIAATSPGQE